MRGNLTAKHNPHRASMHKDRKRVTKKVRGQKHKGDKHGQ